jgi:hypothetical protein
VRTDLTADDRTLLDSGDYDVHWEIEVANGSGTMVDLTGRLAGVSFSLPNPNAPIAPATFTFLRELERDPNKSLAPLVAASTLNRLDDGATYSVLLQVGRAVIVRWAHVARGAARPASGYYEVYRGRIAAVAWPDWDDGPVTIRCTDQSGALQKSKSTAAYTYAAGTTIKAAAQAALDNNGWSTYTVGGSATAEVLAVDHTPGVQKTVWSQVWNFYQSIGWVVWWRYDATGAAVLTGFEPDRDNVTSAFTVAGLRAVSAVSYSEEEIGNEARGIYSDADGVRREAGPVRDLISIDKYGGFARPYWIVEQPDSPIRDGTSMLALLTAAISDTAEPDVLVEITTPANPFLECSVDVITVPAYDRFWDSAQKLAPFSVTVEHQAGRDHQSRIGLRGRPSAGKKTWEIRRPPIEVPDAPETMLLKDVRVRDSADGLSEVISWTNGAKGEEIWYAVKTFTGPLTSDMWGTVAAVVETAGSLIETLTITKPTETDGTARVTLVQIELRWEDPATGEMVASDAVGGIHRLVIKPKTSIAAIDPETGDLASGSVRLAKQFAVDVPVAAFVDTAANLPANNSAADYYIATDTRQAYQWDGSAWLAWDPATDGPTYAFLPALTAGVIKAVYLQALALEVGQYIESSGYVAGSAGWHIDAGGTAEFRDVTVRGTLTADTVASDGTTNKSIPKGVISGTVKNTGSVTFPTTYDSAPVVIFSGGATDQDGSKWGTSAAADALGGNGNGADARPAGALIFQSVGADVSTTGFTASLKLIARGTITAKSASFGTPTTVTTVGSSTGSATPADADVPSTDDKYTAAFTVSGANDNTDLLGPSETMSIRVALDVAKDGGATFSEVATKLVSLTIAPGETVSEASSITATVTGIDGGNDSFRLRVKEVFNDTNTRFVSMSVTNPALTWNAESDAKYASMTPNGDADAVRYFVIAEG